MTRGIKCLLVVLALFVVGVPPILHFVIFPNGFLPAEWAGFLGSYVGGAIGGIGTLLAVYITTKETRDIQAGNNQKIEEDRAEKEKAKRKEFADGVIEDIAKFVADVTVFADKYRNYHKALENKKSLEVELEKTSKSIIDIYKDAAEKDDAGYNHFAKNRELEEKKEILLRKIDLCNKQIEIASIEASRIVALEKYTALCIKLRGIEEEEQILDKMEEINNSSKDAAIEFEKIGGMIDELLDIIDAFAKRYIEQG